MRKMMIGSTLAAGLLLAGAAQAAVTPAPAANSGAPAKPVRDEVVDDGSGGDEGELPARRAAPAGDALTPDDVVSATREGLSRSRIGSGIRQLRILDYILIGGVGLLLVLVILLIGLVMGLRGRIAKLAPDAPARGLGQEEEQLYAARPLP